MSTLDCTDSDFGLGADLEEIRQQVRRFAAAEIAPRAAEIDLIRAGDRARAGAQRATDQRTLDRRTGEAACNRAGTGSDGATAQRAVFGGVAARPE